MPNHQHLEEPEHLQWGKWLVLGSTKVGQQWSGGFLLPFMPVGLLGCCSGSACITASTLAASAGDSGHLPEAEKVSATSSCQVLLTLKGRHHLECPGIHLETRYAASLLACDSLPAGGAALVQRKGSGRGYKVQLHPAWWPHRFIQSSSLRW